MAAGRQISEKRSFNNNEQQKHMLDENLFPLIQSIGPTSAGKITGMLLEMDISEIINLIMSHDALKIKVYDAQIVLNEPGSSIKAH